MNFETFFNHKFLQRPEPPISQSPLQTVELPLPNIYGSPPTLLPRVTPLRCATPVKIASTPPVSQPGTIIIVIIIINPSLKVIFTNCNILESPRSTRAALSSSPEDDFVLVPSNLPSDHSSDSLGDKQ